MGKPAYEFEYRFLHFDRREVLRRAGELGADIKNPDRTLLINTMFRLPGHDKLRIRLRLVVRHASVQAVLTVKRIADASGFEEEHESAVADGAQVLTMLELLGCKREYTMEKFRDIIHVPGLGELDLDSHPGLPALLEVECPTEAKLARLVKALGLAPPPRGTPQQSPQELYSELYGVSNKRDKSGDMTFSHPSNLLAHVRHDRKRFDTVLATQRKRAVTLKQRHGLH
jgi:adenylate cyclase class IV